MTQHLGAPFIVQAIPASAVQTLVEHAPPRQPAQVERAHRVNVYTTRIVEKVVGRVAKRMCVGFALVEVTRMRHVLRTANALVVIVLEMEAPSSPASAPRAVHAQA